MNRLKFIPGILFFFLAFSSAFAAEPVPLRILHLNDFHGFAEPVQPAGAAEKAGGLAYLAGAVHQLGENRPALLLAAGDFIQGHPWTNLFEGKSTIEAMNAMNFSAMVPGNHEFDFGQDVLKRRIAEAGFPVLAANVLGFPPLKPFVIQEIAGLKVAMIGLITEETPSTTHPKNVEGLTFSPVIETARKWIGELKDQVDLVIVLSHQGLPADVELAKAVAGIDIIVGAHSHTRIEKPMRINETLIVQSWEHAKVLGLLDVTVQDKKIVRHEGRQVVIGPGRQQPDAAVARIVDRYRMQAAEILNEVIGEAEADVTGKESRSRETPLGNLVADVLREQTDADAALINGGGIRTDIPKGPLRMNDILAALPFPCHAVVLKISGRELKDILEHGISNPEGEEGRFPQVSGIQLTYRLSRPSGQRITGLTIRGKPLQPDVWYTLATTDFLAAGGDGYAAFTKILETMYNKDEDSAKTSRVLLIDSGRTIRDMVIQRIRERKTISAAMESRIQKEN